MAFKTITIKKNIYDKLKEIKPKDESFSDFLEEVAETRKGNPMKFAGAWSTMKDEEFERIKKTIFSLRKSANENFERRIEKVLK